MIRDWLHQVITTRYRFGERTSDSVEIIMKKEPYVFWPQASDELALDIVSTILDIEPRLT